VLLLRVTLAIPAIPALHLHVTPAIHVTHALHAILAIRVTRALHVTRAILATPATQALRIHGLVTLAAHATRAILVRQAANKVPAVSNLASDTVVTPEFMLSGV